MEIITGNVIDYCASYLNEIDSTIVAQSEYYPECSTLIRIYYGLNKTHSTPLITSRNQIYPTLIVRKRNSYIMIVNEKTTGLVVIGHPKMLLHYRNGPWFPGYLFASSYSNSRLKDSDYGGLKPCDRPSCNVLRDNLENSVPLLTDNILN
jgi:hypothetical protein